MNKKCIEQLKHILDLKNMQNIQKEKFGLIFYTGVNLKKRKPVTIINKIVSLSYLFTIINLDSSLRIYPKFPNFFTYFNRIDELNDSMILNSLFIKISNIFNFCKSLSLKFFIENFIIMFFCSLLYFFKFHLSIFFFSEDSTEFV